jgi:hypothetical protein
MPQRTGLSARLLLVSCSLLGLAGRFSGVARATWTGFRAPSSCYDGSGVVPGKIWTDPGYAAAGVGKQSVVGLTYGQGSAALTCDGFFPVAPLPIGDVVTRFQVQFWTGCQSNAAQNLTYYNSNNCRARLMVGTFTNGGGNFGLNKPDWLPGNPLLEFVDPFETIVLPNVDVSGLEFNLSVAVDLLSAAGGGTTRVYASNIRVNFEHVSTLTTTATTAATTTTAAVAATTATGSPGPGGSATTGSPIGTTTAPAAAQTTGPAVIITATTAPPPSTTTGRVTDDAGEGDSAVSAGLWWIPFVVGGVLLLACAAAAVIMWRRRQKSASASPSGVECSLPDEERHDGASQSTGTPPIYNNVPAELGSGDAATYNTLPDDTATNYNTLPEGANYNTLPAEEGAGGAHYNNIPEAGSKDAVIYHTIDTSGA